MASQTGSPYACTTSQPYRQQVACDEELDREKARFSDWAIWKKSVELTEEDFKTDPAGAVAKLLAAEKTCDAFIFRESVGTYDGGAAVNGKSGGRLKEKEVNNKRTFVLTDLDYVGNEKFWDDVKANQSDYNFCGWTERRAWPVIDQDLAISPKGPISDDPEAGIEGEITIAYSRLRSLYSYLSDVKALAVKPFLAFVALTNGAASAASIGAAPNDTVVTVARNAAMDVAVGFTGSETFGVKRGTPLPAGITLNAAGHLVGQVALAGTYKFAVRAFNECGIMGEVLVTLVVTP